MLHVVTWHWGTKYPIEDVLKLQRGIARNLDQPYRFFVVRPSKEDEHLTKSPGCFCRLRMFDPVWQKSMGVVEGDRIVCVDLDSVVTGWLDPLFTRAENFVILHGANASNPCKFNGSIFMLRAGAHPEVWSDFSIDKAGAIPFYEFPDDQGWLHHKLPHAAGWNAGDQSGVYAFKKPGWPKGDGLPKGARLVVFPGHRSPEKFKHLPWIKENWV